MHTSRRSRKDLDNTKIEADEKAVVSVMKTIQTMINPFETGDKKELVHLASGVVATPAIAEDMRTMLEKGKLAADNFMKSNIVGEEPNIHATIKKTKLDTFSSLGKKVIGKNKKGELVALKNSKILFTKMLLIAKSRNLQMEHVLKYSLRPFPCSLSTSEGDLVKTSKAKLLHAVEEEVEDGAVSELPATAEKALTLDAMAMLQTLTPIPGTFGELAQQLLEKAVNIAVYSNCTRVDFVCDRYPRESIKDLERNKRAANGVQVVRIYSEDQKVPRQWKKFMSSGDNKEELMKFLHTAWKKADARLLKGVDVFLSHEEKCHRFIQSNEQLTYAEVEELSCDHEEADTRMIAHARHASQVYPNIIIRSPDTDVFFIALNACVDIDANIFFETGVGNGRRIIALGTIRHSLGDQWCRSLLGLHAFTG